MKSRFLFPLLAVGAMFFTGCSKNEPPIPDPEKGGGILSLTLTKGDVTQTTFEVHVKASNNTDPYLCLNLGAKVDLDNMTDAELFEIISKDLTAQANQQKVTLDKFIESIALRGSKDLKIDKLIPNTSYAVVAFGVKGEKMLEPSSRMEFTTTNIVMSDCTFDITATVDHNSVVFDVKPSDKTVDWYLCAMTKEQYDGVQGETKWEKERMLQEYFAAETGQLLSSGMTPEEVLAQLLHKGDATLEAKGLAPQTEYIFLAGAIGRYGESLYLISNAKDGLYTTQDPWPSDMTFELNATNIRKTRAHVTVTPSSLTETFIWACMPFTAENLNKTAKELMEYYIATWPPMFPLFMAYSKGVQDFPEFSVTAGQLYYLLAFGHSGAITTEASMITFETEPGGNPADVKIETDIVKVQPYEAILGFRSSDETVNYQFGLIPDAVFNADELKAAQEAGMQQALEMQQQFNPAATMADVISMACFTGDTPTYRFSDLNPNVSYTLATLAYTLDGKVARLDSKAGYLKTPKLSTASTTGAVVGYFDGAQENGTVFGDAGLTKDKAIIVVKYTLSSNATGLYNFTQVDDPEADLTDPTVISDEDIYRNLSGSWLTGKPAAPYLFILTAWDKDQMNFAHATDINNVYGPINRYRIPGANWQHVDPIAKLKELHDLANIQAAQSFSSILTGKNISKAPTMKNISSYIQRRAVDLSVLPQTSSILHDKSTVMPQNMNFEYRLGTYYYLPMTRSMR